MNKNKQAIIWAGVAFVAIIFSVWTYAHQTKHSVPAAKKTLVVKATTSSTQNIISNTTTATSTVSTSPTATPTSSAATSTPASKTLNYRPKKNARVTPTSTPLSYGDAVNKYMDHRIQFNQICQAIPGQVAFANHITIMLDNRSDSPQKIILAGQVYTVAAYNYVLVTLNQHTIPTTLHVSCNNQMNAVEIMVE